MLLTVKCGCGFEWNSAQTALPREALLTCAATVAEVHKTTSESDGCEPSALIMQAYTYDELREHSISTQVFAGSV